MSHRTNEAFRKQWDANLFHSAEIYTGVWNLYPLPVIRVECVFVCVYYRDRCASLAFVWKRQNIENTDNPT